MTTPVPSVLELARFTLAAQHPTTRRWEDDDVRLGRLASAHELDVRLATDHALAAQRAKAIRVGQDAGAFLNRWVRLRSGLEVMLSIRFEGLDPDKPFVDASVLSRPVSTDDLAGLAEAGIDAYGAFHPGYLRVWSSAEIDAFRGTRRDKRFLAARMGELADRGNPPPALTVAPARDLANYPDAEAAYAAVDRAYPAHREQAMLQSRADLAVSIAEGILFDVLVDGSWAGYVGATEDSAATLGLPAYVIQEIILIAEQRGRGYGRHLTTLLARALPDRRRILLGTIHADNRGAIVAATRAGREDVGGWFQVPLPTAALA